MSKWMVEYFEARGKMMGAETLQAEIKKLKVRVPTWQKKSAGQPPFFGPKAVRIFRGKVKHNAC